MKIVHLLDHDITCFGGIENYVRDLAELQAREGNMVFVISSADACLVNPNNYNRGTGFSFSYIIK